MNQKKDLDNYITVKKMISVVHIENLKISKITMISVREINWPSNRGENGLDLAIGITKKISKVEVIEVWFILSEILRVILGGWTILVLKDNQEDYMKT